MRRYLWALVLAGCVTQQAEVTATAQGCGDPASAECAYQRGDEAGVIAASANWGADREAERTWMLLSLASLAGRVDEMKAQLTRFSHLPKARLHALANLPRLLKFAGEPWCRNEILYLTASEISRVQLRAVAASVATAWAELRLPSVSPAVAFGDPQGSSGRSLAWEGVVLDAKVDRERNQTRFLIGLTQSTPKVERVEAVRLPYSVVTKRYMVEEFEQTGRKVEVVLPRVDTTALDYKMVVFLGTARAGGATGIDGAVDVLYTPTQLGRTSAKESMSVDATYLVPRVAIHWED
jgi:hypothetical protein